MGKILKLVIVGLLAVHCSKSANHSHNQPAPSKEADLGFIVTATPSEIAAIEKNEPQAGIRLLDKSTNLYEINHIEAAALSTRLANKNLQKNMFMQSTVVKPKRWDLKMRAQNTSADAMSALQSCQGSPVAPDVTFDEEASPVKTRLVLGESITLVAKGVPNKLVGGDVRFMWDVLPPEFSTQSIATGIAPTQTFTPDSVGLYQIALIGQGTDSSCSGVVLEVLVTANPARVTTETLSETPDTALFKHLDQIKAREAWVKARGEGQDVAVLDTGVNYNHPSIRDNVRAKTVEEEAADGNDFKDDTMGWDFVNGDNMPFDDNGHGSHVSGLIGSNVAGVAPGSRIIPVKVLDAAGSGDLASVVAGVLYAVNNGAKIINISMAIEMPTAALPLVAAFEVARQKGVMIFVAAGNGDPMTGQGFDIAIRPSQPAAVKMDNVISIAATAEGTITSYSNFSDKLVHVAAPGGDDIEPVLSIATTNPENRFFAAEMGTSMASPVAAGVGALVLSANPKLTPAQVKTILMESGDSMASLEGKTISGKQVNALAAVQKALDLNLAPSMN